MTQKRDHGGGLDHAIKEYGGTRTDWLDLSTGINPISYPIPEIPNDFWHALPDTHAHDNLINAARNFWHVDDSVEILPSSGVSQLICMLPKLTSPSSVKIYKPTYNEHEAAFKNAGWNTAGDGGATVLVHPNNPDGRLFDPRDINLNESKLTIIDESFCDVTPENTLVDLAKNDGVIVLKGLGKFWGLAGLRLGFAIAKPETIEQLAQMIGPWAISGPAQFIGAKALQDFEWATKTRGRLANDATKLDELMMQSGHSVVGGTNLFRLYDVADANLLQFKMAKHMVWSRRFPYSKTWVRFGLPGTPLEWDKFINALEA